MPGAYLLVVLASWASGTPVSGTSVFPAMEGSRPVLVEIQALTVRLASGATPRRAAVGWDSGRLAMILAVLEARCGMSFATAEVYLNVAGGYRLSDPAADLAVAAALVSAMSERPVPSECVVLGEIALSGKEPPRSCRIQVSGAGTLGHGNGSAQFEITPDGEGASRLTFKGAGEIGGLVAGVGQRILSSVSKHLVGRFFTALRKECETPVEGAAE